MKNQLAWSQIVLQLCLAILVLYFYQFESKIFTLANEIFLLGALICGTIPQKFRLKFLSLIGLGGVFILFPAKIAAAWITLFFFTVFLLKLKLPSLWRFLLLSCLAIAVYYWRNLGFCTEYADFIVPIFGTVFLLRSVSYFRESAPGLSNAGWEETIAFFALLPNCVMWFFPLIDFKKFVEGSKTKINLDLLQRGIDGVQIGILQLFFYRILQTTWDLPAQNISSYGDLVHFLIITYLHYIRISGAFHLVVGALCLYGIDLPRTHILYFFSEGFLDLSRRLNIYWKDFMATQVYRPIYETILRWGDRIAAVCSIASVFLVSCLMHPFIYLWPRGIYRIRLEDWLFWGICGVWVCCEVVLYKRRGKNKASSTISIWRRACRITSCFFFFSIVWGIWNSPSIKDLAALLVLAKWRGIKDIWTLLWFPFVGFIGAVYFYLEQRWIRSKAPIKQFRWQDAWNIFTFSLLVMLACSGLQKYFSPKLSAFAHKMSNANFEIEYEAEKRSYDYYEGLKTSPLQLADEDELPIEQQPYFEALHDYRRRQFRANVKARFMGHSFVTNRWGMPCSRDFPLEKPKKRIRIAIVGASNAMAYGIDPDKDWPRQAEAILNSRTGTPVEILNFSVIGYSSMITPLVFEDRIWKFHPDIVIYAGGAREYYINGFNAGLALRGGLTIPYPELYSLLGVKGKDDYFARHYFTVAPVETEFALFDWGISKLAQYAKDSGAKLLYLLTPTLYVGSDDSHRRTKADEMHMMKKAKELGFAVYNPVDLFSGHDIREVTLADDLPNYNHLSQAGHNILGKYFANALEDYLHRVKGKRF